MEEEKHRGRVCVTGGTGFVASWLIMRLLQRGYSVNATVRSYPTGTTKDVSYLTNLPGASERLQILYADLDKPDSFDAAIEGCVGVFHVAHPMDFVNKESEETITSRSVGGLLGILKACLNSKTVRRVVYTSSTSTVSYNEEGLDVVDETSWSDVDYIRKMNLFAASYYISKTMTEKAAFEFAEKNSLDLVTVIPPWMNGPFICPHLPDSVKSSLAMIIGNEKQIKYFPNIPFVHTDDVASAHIFHFENPEAKGRYICSAVEITPDKLYEFISATYPEFQISIKDRLTDPNAKFVSLSSKKLLEAGFTYKYGLKEMFDDAVECCRQKGFL